MATVRPTMEKIFTKIYEHKLWGVEGDGSGTGSSKLATRGASAILYHLCLSLGLYGMIDAPCGAMVWQPSLLRQIQFQRPHFRYLGIDVVRSLIHNNTKRFEQRANNSSTISFMHANLASQTNWSLPEGYDLILCRDAMQHLPYVDIWTVLQRFAKSQSKYILLGSYPYGSQYCQYKNNSSNRNLATPGAYFCIDLQSPPFSLIPAKRFSEGTFDKKWLLLFERDQLKAQLHERHVGFLA